MSADGFPDTPLSRRAFLRWGMAAGLGLAWGALFAGGCSRLFQSPLEAAAVDQVERWVYSTCGFCGIGCAVWLGVKGNRLVAVKGVAEYPVNRGLLCVKGIYQFKVVSVPGRAEYPLLRRGSAWERVTWDEALDKVCNAFRRYLDRSHADSLAIYHSSQILLEEDYILAKLGRGALGLRHFDSNSSLCLSSAVEGYVLSFGSDGQPVSFPDVEKADCLLLIGTNMAENHPILFYRLVRAVRKRKPYVAVIDPRRTPTAEIATRHLAVRPGTDMDLLKAMIQVIITEKLFNPAFVEAHTKGFSELAERVRKYTPESVAPRAGVGAEEIREVARAFGRSTAGLIAWGAGVNQSTEATATVNLINNLCLITGNVGRPGTGPLSLAGQCASLSVREAGGTKTLPGMRPFDDEGARRELARLWGVPQDRFPKKTASFPSETFKAIEEGKVKALWIIGSNPAVSMPDTNRFKAVLRKLDFLVVQDCYRDTETARFAHVLLPAAMWAEKDGTFTNSERRVNLVRKAVDPPGQAKPDWAICVLVAERLGFGSLFRFRSSEEIFNEWRRVSAGTIPDMSGMTYDRIRRLGGIQWPCPAADSRGTARLYATRRFPTKDGRARLLIAPAKKTATPNDEYPFLLLTGRILQHWLTGTKTRRIPEVRAEVGVPFVEISPDDARRLGVRNWDPLHIESRHGSVTVRARITTRVVPGQLFYPFHFWTLPANLLIPLATDPLSGQPDVKRIAIRVRRGELGEP